MKALFFVGGYRPEMLGIGRFVPHYVDALSEAGWNVDVRAPYPFYPAWKMDRRVPRISEEHNGRVRITRYTPFVPRRPNAVSRALHEVSIGLSALRHLFRSTRSVDLVVAASPPLLGAAAAGWFARYRGRPSLILAYDLVADLASDAFGVVGRAPGKLMRRVEANLYAQASAVVALSDDMAARIRELSGRVSTVPVIHIWADDELLQLDQRHAAQNFRRRLGIPEDQRLIGFAGNFGRKQRLLAVADALRGLPSDFTALLVGDGPDRPGLEEIARAGPSDIRILPPLKTPELHAFLSSCDLSVVIAWTKHAGSLFPSKVANILAAGSPIMAIASEHTELAKLVESQDLGVVCRTLEPSMIIDAVRRGALISRDPTRRARCRRIAQMHFSRSQAMASFLSQVDELMGRWRPTSR